MIRMHKSIVHRIVIEVVVSRSPLSIQAEDAAANKLVVALAENKSNERSIPTLPTCETLEEIILTSEASVNRVP